MTDRPTLHLLCGKAGAGKSTLAARLADHPDTILLSQDHWTATLWPGELLTVADYIERAARLNAAMTPHLVELLRAGLSLVLDWPANTVAGRAWMRGLADEAGVQCTLHWLDLSDDAAWSRCETRNAAGDHPYRMTRAQFDEITGYFQPPTAGGGVRDRRPSRRSVMPALSRHPTQYRV